MYLPQYDDEEGVWANAEDCLGNAPLDMQYKYPIIARYEAAFPGVDLNTVTRFFLDTLNINQCSWKDVVEDLKVLKSRDISDFDRICSRYVQLSELCSSSTPADVDMEKLRCVMHTSTKTVHGLTGSSPEMPTSHRLSYSFKTSMVSTNG